MKLGQNVVGPQVRMLRMRKGWTQLVLAGKLQLLGWGVTKASVGKLEAQLRRVSDCELVFLARVLDVSILDFFQKIPPLKQLGPHFRGGRGLKIFPSRGER